MPMSRMFSSTAESISIPSLPFSNKKTCSPLILHISLSISYTKRCFGFPRRATITRYCCHIRAPKPLIVSPVCSLLSRPTASTAPVVNHLGSLSRRVSYFLLSHEVQRMSCLYWKRGCFFSFCNEAACLRLEVSQLHLCIFEAFPQNHACSFFYTEYLQISFHSMACGSQDAAKSI